MNPRLPVELKRLKGTLNVTREKEAMKSEKVIAASPLVFGEEVQKIACPKEITDSYVKKFWKNYTKALLSVHAFGAGDIPQFTRLCIVLQKLREVQQTFATLSVFDEDFDLWEKRYKRLADHFDSLAGKFYLSPAERAKMKLDSLTIKEKELSVTEKEQSAITALLGARK